MKVKTNGYLTKVEMTPLEVGKLAVLFDGVDVIDEPKRDTSAISPEWIALGLVAKGLKYTPAELVHKVMEVKSKNKELLEGIIHHAQNLMKHQESIGRRAFYDLDDKLQELPNPEDFQSHIYHLTEKGKALIQAYKSAEVGV
jgi:hypothetical protein